MKKLLLIFLVFISFASYGQRIQKANTYGLAFNRTGADTLFYLPSDTFTVPAAYLTYPFMARKGANVYIWNTSSNVWQGLTGGTLDTTGAFITSVYRRSDSVFYVKGGVHTFAFIDSTGVGIPTLQQVLTAGSTLTEYSEVDGGGFNLEIINVVEFVVSAIGAASVESSDGVNVSALQVRPDSIYLYPHLGQLNIDSLRSATDTTTRKPMVWSPTTGRWEYLTYWPGGGGSYTFTNGLTDSSGTVKLGGTLTEGTTTLDGGTTSTLRFQDMIFDVTSSIITMLGDSISLTGGTSTNRSDIVLKNDTIKIKPGLGLLYIDTLTSAVGTKALRYNPTTGLVSYADTTTGGSTNTSVGSGYKVAIDATNNIKSLTGGYGITLDSATSNQVGIKADTATLFPAVRATIPAGSTINKVGQDFFISNDSLFLKDEANIYDYGATAGGDILIPLKAALASSKKTIIIPNANFTISDTVIVPSYKRIIGNTGANITQTTSGKGILVMQQDSYVSGVEFIGTGYSAAMPSSVNGEYGVKIVGSRVEVDNCKFSLLEHGVIFGGLTVLNRCIIKDNLIYANKGGITAFQNIEYSTIINNRIYDGYIGIWLRDEANLLISNNTITYNTVGIRWDGLASNSDHDIVIGNQFNHCDTMAYVLKNNTSLDFIGNHFMVGKIVMGTTDSVRLHTFNGNGFGSTTFSIINGREINFVNNSFYNPSTWTNSVGVKKYLNVGETNDALPGASISGTDNNIVRIDGTASLQDSKVSISDNGDITAGNSGTSTPVLTVQDYGNNYALGNTQSSLLLKGRWWSGDSNPSLYSSARIDLVRNAGDGAGGSNLVFKVSGTGATGLIEAFRATSYKNFLINYGTDDGNKKFRVDHNDVALTSPQYAAYITQRSTFNTTGGNIISTGAYIGNTSSRSSGGNSLTNIGLQVDASGGQNNYGIIVSSGSVGIGTQSPTVALDVVGAGKFTLASGYATNINGSLGANDFATKGYVDSTRSLESTYTPSLTNTTNIAASTAYVTNYKRQGDYIYVWGEVQIDATSALTISEMGLSLPVASSITDSRELAGTGAFEDNTIVQIKGDGTNARAMFRFIPQTNTANTYSFHFSYKYVAP